MTAPDAERPSPPAPVADARRWRFAVFATSAPLLVVALVASALADRLVFLGWGAVATLLAVGALRRASAGGGSLGRLLGAGLLGHGVSYGLFALLLTRHGDALDLGWRAVFWSGWRTAWVATPGPWALLALVAAAVGVVLLRR